MVRIEMRNVDFNIKNELKLILPKRTNSKWQWKKNHWAMTIQSCVFSKSFQKRIKDFRDKYNTALNVHEWDGFNKPNNY